MPSIDRDFTLEVLSRLVQINSVNPSLVHGAPGEAEIASFIHDRLTRCGISAQILEPESGRTSVLGCIQGTGGGRSLMLNAHCDTVGVDGMPDPFSAAVRDGRLYGRGSFDMKGSLAACIAAAKSLKDSNLRGDIYIAVVADEEYGSIGTRDVLTRIRPDAAIVTEPTALDICLAHKGYLWIDVEVTGRAAHGSKFELGIDANMKMGQFLSRLSKLEACLRKHLPHPLVGPPSLHAATLQGGTGLSTYAASCRLQIERRTIPGETEAVAVGEIQSIVDTLSMDDPEFRAAVNCFFSRDPFEVAPDAEIVQHVTKAVERTVRRTPHEIGDTPWMDAALLQAAGVETVVIGPAGAGAHSAIEYVELGSVYSLAEILVETARTYCA